MPPAAKLTVTLVLLVLLGGLGAADYFLAEGGLTGDVAQEQAIPDDGADTQNVPASAGTGTITRTHTGSQTPLPAPGVAKSQGLTVAQAAQQRGLELRETEEMTLLSQIVGEGQTVSSAVLLQDGDRAGAVAWIESADVKTVFSTLKEALITVFSPQMQDLRDETLQTPGAPVRNVLSFWDPALSEERIVFVRVRERLFEFHLAEESDAVMQTFIQTLTSR